MPKACFQHVATRRAGTQWKLLSRKIFASSTTLFDDLDTDSDGFISPEEDKAALFRWYKERESASAED